MDKTLIYLDDSPLAHRIQEEIKDLENFIFYHKNDWKVKIKHFDMYKEVFDLCEKKRIKRIYFLLDVSDIDVLLNEARKRRNIKIVFRVPYRELFRGNKSRIISYRKLIGLSNVEKCLVFSQDREGTDRKCMTFTEPVNEKKEDYEIERIYNNFNVLFFGRITEAKGIDLFLESKKYNDIEYRVVGSTEFYDGELKTNISIRDEFVDDKEIPQIFTDSDIVVMPYTKLYDNGSSGIFPQACFAKKLIVVTDIYPYNKLVKKYGLGLVCQENPKDLSDKLIELRNNYDYYLDKAKFDDFIKTLSTWRKVIASLTFCQLVKSVSIPPYRLF